MNRSLKCAFLCALASIGILYWTLALISGWLMCDDSKAVEKFMHEHDLLTTLPACIWAADAFGGRYIVTAILVAAAGWVLRR